ncbi:hypothetical protein AIT68_005202 [Salmonella enterica subsp. salamae]|uniref:hypothetical protein n=1 Tax=Salmonella enterica TaxID=28901 RepID=UPI001E418BA8|nr:hypothetical protein [Salmonella enterica]
MSHNTLPDVCKTTPFGVPVPFPGLMVMTGHILFIIIPPYLPGLSMILRYPVLLASLLMVGAFSVRGELPLPQDVQHFLSNAEICQHLAGEWDSSLPEEDKKDIEKGINTWCPPAKAALPELRKKYKENKEVIKKLSEYDF